MEEIAHASLAPWESFYVIVGSSAAALTGLQFVVIVLIAEMQRRSTSTQIAAFGTPTVVHFSAALLVSALMSAPWPTLGGARAMLFAIGLAGLAYAIVVIRRARRQTGYTLVLEDWLWHTAFPLIAYGALVVAGIILGGDVRDALFVVGGTTLLLLFIGIHNAWDAVTYIAFVERNREDTRDAGAEGPAAEGAANRAGAAEG